MPTARSLRPGSLRMLLAGLLIGAGAASGAPAQVSFAGGDPPPPDASSGFDFPLLVHEVLPPNATGFRRVDEPVSVGVPIPDSARVANVSELAVSGVEAFQIRPLAAWPSGNLKWVQLDFLATVEEHETVDGICLIRGSEPRPSAAPLGMAFADRIRIDTGPLRVVATRSGRGILRKISVDEQKLLEGEHRFELRAFGMDAEPYFGEADRVFLEENGPVKAVLRADGVHRDNEGRELFDFTLRLTFFRGHRSVRGEYTLRNASRHRPYHLRHRGVVLDVDTRLEGPLTFRFPRHEEPWVIEGVLSPASVAAYVVAFNDSSQIGATEVRWREDTEGWVPAVAYDPEEGFAEEGYRVIVDGEERIRTTRSQFSRVTYARLDDAEGRGVAASIRFGSRAWPISYDAVGSGRLRVGLFSNRTDHHHTANFYTHETREFVLGFHTQEDNPFRLAFGAQYPLVARPKDLSDLNRAGVISDRLVTLEQTNALFERHGIDLRLAPRDDDFDGIRYFRAAQGGGFNQYDHAHHDLLHFLRTGESWAWLQAAAWADYRSSFAVLHSDDFVYATDGSYPLVIPQNGGEFLTWRGHVFDNGHRHSRYLPLAYYLTGKERYREAFADEIETVAFEQRVAVGYLNSRIQSRLVHLGMLGAEFLRDTGPFRRDPLLFDPDLVRENIRGYMRAILDARYDFSRICSGAQPKGWSDEPGQSLRDERRFWFAGGDRERNVEPKFTVYSIFPIALWNYRFHCEPGAPEIPEIDLRILDLEHYFWNHLYARCPQDPELRTIGDAQYHLFPGCSPPDPPAQCAVHGENFHPAYQLFAFAHAVTGDPNHLARGIEFLRGQHEFDHDLMGVNTRRSEFQDFVHRVIEAERDGLAPGIDLQRLTARDGKVRARWNTDEWCRAEVTVRDGSRSPRIVTGEGLDKRHTVALPELPRLRPLHYGIASTDFAGNRTEGSERIWMFDDFQEDSLGAYDTGASGGGRILYSPSSRCVKLRGASRSVVHLALNIAPLSLEGRSRGGQVSFSLGLGRTHAPRSALVVRLEASPRTLYRATLRDDPQGRTLLLERFVNGELLERSFVDGSSIPSRCRIALGFQKRRLVFHVAETGESFPLETAVGRPIDPNRIEIRVGRRSAVIDDLLFERF